MPISSSPAYSPSFPPTAAAGFLPTDLTGLELWLDAADASTITDVAGAVSQWDDKSGNGYNATQGSASAQPATGTRTMNGLNTIDFDGYGDRMPLPSGMYNIANGENALFVVSQMDSVSSSDSRRLFRGALWGFDRHVKSTGYRLVHSGSPHLIYYSPTYDLVPRIDSFNADTLIKGYLDGVFKGSTTRANATLTDLVAGGHSTSNGAESWGGAISEAIAFSRALTTEEYNQVGNYLANKWGITWTDI